MQQSAAYPEPTAVGVKHPLRASGAERDWGVSGVIAKLAAEGVRLLHQRFARHNFEHLPEVLGVLHVLRRLAADDDDRADQLMVLGAKTHVADK